MKPQAALLLFLLASSCALAATSPILAVRSDVTILQKGSVSLDRGEFISLDMNVSMPRQESYQKVESADQLLFDSEGNPYIAISVQNPANPYPYSKSARVTASSRSTPTLPESYIVPAGYSRYLLPTARTQSADPRIAMLARKLTENASTPFEKLLRIAIYVNENTEYDESLIGQEKDALWVLENRRGVCIEYSTLFAALSRSAGIPTRFLTGYAYSDRFNGWVGHAWNEAFIGEWVPVDATWFELGSLDAMHIEESKLEEMESRNSVSASVTSQNAHLDWDASGKGGAMADNVMVNEVEYFEPLENFKFFAAESSLAASGQTLVFLTLEGTGYSASPVSLATCSGTDILQVSNSSQYALLEPGKQTTIAWQVRASGKLSKDYTYTCPLTLNSPSLAHRTLEIKVDPSENAPAQFSAALSKSMAKPWEENSALLSIPSPLRGKKFYLLAGGKLSEARMNGATGEIPFTASGAGMQKVLVAAEGGGALELSYLISENSTIRIDSISLEKAAYSGAMAKVVANISANSYPKDVSLSFIYGKASLPYFARISGPLRISFEFVPDSPGEYQAALAASSAPGGPELDRKSLLITVLEAPLLSILSTKTASSEGALSTEISFAKAGDVVAPLAEISGKAYPAGAPIKLALPPGEHAITLRWLDPSGNNYTSVHTISVRAPGILEAFASPRQEGETGAAAPFCPAMASLFAATLASSLALKKKVE